MESTLLELLAEQSPCLVSLYHLLSGVCVCVSLGGTQNCDIMVNITAADDNDRVQVDRTGRVCLRCLNANGVTSVTTTWGYRDGSTVSDRENQNPAEGEYFEGMLVLLPGVLGNGSVGEYRTISCISGPTISPQYNIFDVQLYSSGE